MRTRGPGGGPREMAGGGGRKLLLTYKMVSSMKGTPAYFMRKGKETLEEEAIPRVEGATSLQDRRGQLLFWGGVIHPNKCLYQKGGCRPISGKDLTSGKHPYDEGEDLERRGVLVGGKLVQPQGKGETFNSERSTQTAKGSLILSRKCGEFPLLKTTTEGGGGNRRGWPG